MTLCRILADGGREQVFSSQTDDGGRLSAFIDPQGIDTTATYELVLSTAEYWSSLQQLDKTTQTVDEVVMRFRMPDPHARYHMPFILGANGYSVWWSQPEV